MDFDSWIHLLELFMVLSIGSVIWFLKKQEHRQ